MTTLLVVDDNAGVRLTLSAILEDEGFTVNAAASVAEGHRALEVDGADYDGVLLDVHLKDGLGTELVPLIRARLPRAKVILLSGSAEPGAHPCGADAELTKAGDFELLIAQVRRVLAAPAAATSDA